MAKLLLIRHAERPDIPANSVGNEVLLTDKGKADTRNFARIISDPVISIQSSPIGRCLQTAEIIAEVVGFPKSHIEDNSDLGDPGYIIEDGRKAWKHWQRKGASAVNNYLLTGGDKWSGFNDLDQATARFLETIEYQFSMKPNGLHVWITHDTILAAFASRVLDSSLTMEQWPGFLDYISIEQQDGEMVFKYCR